MASEGQLVQSQRIHQQPLRNLLLSSIQSLRWKLLLQGRPQGIFRQLKIALLIRCVRILRSSASRSHHQKVDMLSQGPLRGEGHIQSPMILAVRGCLLCLPMLPPQVIRQELLNLSPKIDCDCLRSHPHHPCTENNIQVVPKKGSGLHPAP